MQDANKTWIVQKFGGSSLADADHFKMVAHLLKGRNEIIVVSAIKDVTSTLQAMLDAAQQNHPFFSTLTHLENQHSELIQSLIPESKQPELIASIQTDCAVIKDVLHAVAL